MLIKLVSNTLDFDENVFYAGQNKSTNFGGIFVYEKYQIKLKLLKERPRRGIDTSAERRFKRFSKPFKKCTRKLQYKQQ